MRVIVPLLFAALTLELKAALLWQDYKETVALIREREEADLSPEYTKRKFCGKMFTDALNDFCVDGADLHKHKLSKQEMSQLLHECCHRGCSLARMAYTFCAAHKNL
ncbi:hypothetical protein QR680_008371 [Steinernema hermaphroditum]|uniref:Insulin-like domain-containing protein n=1 Tax=Steinernema hermaphroditum TaxID=289476 RepID=A0AA39M6X1_9BILA|nr:hypothetical protein QR680_008371 [Steinernema hermaphroditum]